MEKVYVEPTRTTPLINFDPEEGLLEMKGRSSPENSPQFYQRLMDNLDQFVADGSKDIIANFAFEYFNTSSSKSLFDVLKRLSKLEAKGREVIINWYYEEDDDDMMEAGEDYSDLLDLDFNFHEMEE
jgi:hypothetical protein